MKTLAAVFFSDPHIGRTWGAHVVPMTRAELTARYLDPVKELCKKYPDTAIICGGDWYDRAHNDEATIRSCHDLLSEMSIVLAGNHDHVNRAGAVTSLALQQDLVGLSSSPVVLNRNHLTDIWFDTVELSDAVTLYAVPHVGSQQLFEETLMAAESAAGKAKGSKILMVHCNFGAPGEGKPDSNLYLTPQLRDLMEKTFDLIMVGHEHLHRRVGNTIVMGSSQPCNFGELGPRYYYEVYSDGKGLQVEMVEFKTQLTYAIVDVEKAGLDLDVSLPDYAELVDLKGVVPVARAREVQRLVRGLFNNGALAVRMGVTFDKGVTLDGEAVTSSMSNLVQVVRDELSENATWLGLFEDALAELGEEA